MELRLGLSHSIHASVVASMPLRMGHQFEYAQRVDTGMEPLQDAAAKPMTVSQFYLKLNGTIIQFFTPHILSGGNLTNLGLTIALSIALVAFVILVPFAVSCLAAAFILAKDKAKLKRGLEARTTIYEEIGIKRQSLLDTTDNVAYAMHTVSETVPTV